MTIRSLLTAIGGLMIASDSWNHWIEVGGFRIIVTRELLTRPTERDQQ